MKEKLSVHGEVEIERAHRGGKFISDKPRPVKAKLLRFTDKQNILRNSRKLKGVSKNRELHIRKTYVKVLW